MANINDVANFYLTKSSMSHKKLQKMVYYAYSWTLALLNEDVNELRYRLFDDRIEAWVHGPVVPSLYQEYRGFGWNDIPQTFGERSIFSLQEQRILNKVWAVYGSKSADELELMSHGDEPWKKARGNKGPFVSCTTALSDRDIFLYFSGKQFSDTLLCSQ